MATNKIPLSTFLLESVQFQVLFPTKFQKILLFSLSILTRQLALTIHFQLPEEQLRSNMKLNCRTVLVLLLLQISMRTLSLLAFRQRTITKLESIKLWFKLRYLVMQRIQNKVLHLKQQGFIIMSQSGESLNLIIFLQAYKKLQLSICLVLEISMIMTSILCLS